MTKAAVLDTSLQRTHEWLHEVGRDLGFDNERAAYAALARRCTWCGTVFRSNWSRISAPSLPMMVRGIYYEGWHPSAARLKAAHAEDLCDSMRRELQGHDELRDVERVARTVLRVIDRRIEPGQVDRVVDALPKQAREFWRDARQDEDIQ